MNNKITEKKIGYSFYNLVKGHPLLSLSDVNSKNYCVLDFGCGVGKLQFLLPHGVEYIGVDIIDNPKAEFNYIQIRKDCPLPLEDHSVDYIVSHYVLEYLTISELHFYMAELYRVSKRKSNFTFAVGCEYGYLSYGILNLIIASNLQNKFQLQRGRTHQSYIKTLELYGFNLEVSKTLLGPLGFLYKLTSVHFRILRIIVYKLLKPFGIKFIKKVTLLPKSIPDSVKSKEDFDNYANSSHNRLNPTFLLLRKVISKLDFQAFKRFEMVYHGNINKK